MKNSHVQNWLLQFSFKVEVVTCEFEEFQVTTSQLQIFSASNI